MQHDRPEPAAARRDRKERAAAILDGLRQLYPDADCELSHDTALELLLGTILAAQSTDVTVNKVTPVLFARWHDAAAIADAPLEELEEVVHPTGFFRQKARNVRAACRILVDEHGGEVPDTMDALTALPGVARKTANVILGTWFGKQEGIAVDTHVGRLAHRWHLVATAKDEKDAVKIERDLTEVLPRDAWTFFSHATILHGRRVCTARKPACDACDLAPICPSAHVFG